MFALFLRRFLSAFVRLVAFNRTAAQQSRPYFKLLPHLAMITALVLGLASTAEAQITGGRVSRLSSRGFSRQQAAQRNFAEYFAHQALEATSGFAPNRLNLGSVGAGETSTEGSVSFSFTHSVTLGSIDVLSVGAQTSEFANTGTGTCEVGRTYASGDSCTVKVAFSPKTSGLRTAAVVLKDTAQTLISPALVEGTGNRAQVIFFPGTESDILQGLDNDFGIAVDGSGNLFINYNSAGAGGDFVLVKETLQSNGTYVASTLFDFHAVEVNFGGIALDAAGNVYVPDAVGGGGIYKFTAASSYAESYILSGSFVSANDVAFDAAGNMYIAYFGDAAGTGSAPDLTGGLYKSTFSGGAFGAPVRIKSGESTSVAVDGNGNVYASFVTAQVFSSSVGGEVPSASTISKWPAALTSPSVVDSSYTYVSGIAFDPAGNLYISDDNAEGQSTGVAGIFMETPSGGTYTKSAVSLASSISFPTATQILPEDIAIDGDGNLYSPVNTPQGSNNHQEVFELNYANPPTLAFGSVEVGNLSASQSVQIKNIGNLALSISNPASGTNPSPSAGYVVTGGTCPIVTPSTAQGTLAPNASCTYNVAFDPTISGTENGTVTLTDNEQSSATQVISTTGTGLATHFVLSGYSTTEAAGTSFTITVTAENTSNAVDSGYVGTIHFTSSDGAALLPADATLSSGVGTFTFTLNTPGAQTITVTDTVATSLTASTSSITVPSAQATHLQVSAPGSATAGTSFSVTVTALAASNATATGYTGTVHFTSTDGLATLPANYTFVAGDNGVHVFTGTTLKIAGTQTITATDTVTGTITGTSSNIGVAAGAPSSMATGTGTTPQSTTINTAFANPLSVTVKDAFGNVVSGVSVTFTAPGSGASSKFSNNTATITTATNSAGVASASITANAIAGGPYTVTAAASGLTTVNFSLTNLTGAAATVAVSSGSGQSATVTTSFASPLVALVTDAGGNPVSGVTVTFAAPVQTTASATFAGGVTTAITDASGLATSAAITANNHTGGYFVAASAPGAGTSANFSLTNTGSGPTVTTNPVSQSVTAGNTATFTAAATGTPTPTVQWQVSTDGGATFANIAGATSTTLSFTATAGQNGNLYRAVFTNLLGTATTTAATLTVNSAPVVTTNPTSVSVSAGSTATFIAAASGTPTPTVQWQVSTDGGATFSNIAGATSTTLSFSTNVGQNGNQYRAVFTNSVGSATTTAATLTVTAGPVITTTPTNQTVVAGASATFTAAASGSPTPTVQWQVSTDGGATFANIAGATSATLSFTASASQNGNLFRAVFTNSVGSATTTAATLTVNSAPVITTNPVSISVSAGSTAAFTAAASGTPTPTVQWQVSTDGGATFANIAGATSTTLSFSANVSQNGNQYRAVFTNTVGSATTTAATLTVTAGPVITTNPTNQTVVAGATATFTAAATGTPAPTVQWQVSTNGGATFTNIAGATSTTLSFSTTASQSGNLYRAVFTNASGSATTTAATLTVNSAPVVTTNPVNQSVVYNSTATFTAAASGAPTPTVQWQVSTNGGATFTNISGATSTTLMLSGVTVSMSGNSYRAVFTNSAGSATTTAATLTVSQATPVITWANPADILFGGALGSGQLNATANVSGTFSYSPALGTVLSVGNGQTLSVTFTPTDSVDYAQASKSVLINVDPVSVIPANLVSTIVLTRDTSGSIFVTVTVANTGSTAAANVVLTGATLGGTPSATVPVILGSIPASSKTTTLLVFPNVGAAGSRSVLALSGTYTGGAFSSNSRVALP